ncbi:uncharacterized protein PHACADRAFT_252575 [Phanerochaete carnosa HHB-10118-sp]|uniref:Uncharacterized protein n=1 Tax=Phanerochaete carnosa (strain HHB-10118-sp) TaxID=650164 RepID=K5W3A9_PHACS|nr:uncharacterized protein PHACADRAFT_252575 [Phanerochaete carnosa HHB-10118-sp]EKM58333.1 hypothetical protein PHACADRAFT_252575 [Phanerochaete carnosa HHB-10118-sp]
MQSLSVPDLIKIAGSFPLGGAGGAAVASVASLSLVVVLLVSNRLYRRKVAEATNSTTTSAISSPAIDIARYGVLLRQYNERCVYNILVSLGVIYAVCFHIQVQTDVPRHGILGALAIVSMTNAMAGLYLSVLFSDILMDVVRSNTSVLALAGAAESLNLATLLATPFGWTCSATLSFVLYRAAAATAWIFGSREPNPSDERYIATTITLYVLLVIVHSTVSARVFVRLKDHDVAIKEKPGS